MAQSALVESASLSQLRQATHIHGIAVDPKNPSRLYLAAHQGLFVLSAEGLARRLSHNEHDFMGFTPHPTDPSVFYASGHPLGDDNLGLVKSSDGGRTWLEVSTGLSAPVDDFHQMDVSKIDPKTLYGVFGGLQVSHDEGRTWALTAPPPPDLVDLAASAYETDRLYAATTRGLLISQDRGKSWLPAYVHGWAATMVETTANGSVYAFVVGKGLIKGKEPAPRWKVLSTDFGGQSIVHLAVDPTDEDHLYVLTRKGELFTSDDGGRTWRAFAAR